MLTIIADTVSELCLQLLRVLCLKYAAVIKGNVIKTIIRYSLYANSPDSPSKGEK